MNGKKVIFFTAGSVPTEAETLEVDTIVQNNVNLYVRPASIGALYGERREHADLVAGTVPDLYADVPILGAFDGSASVVVGTELTIKDSVDKKAVVSQVDPDTGIEIEIVDVV